MTVSGQVSRILDRHTFEMGPLQGDPILVVSPRVAESIPRGVPLRVTGTVERFRLLALEQRIGIDLDDVALMGLEGRDVLVARVVERADVEEER